MQSGTMIAVLAEPDEEIARALAGCVTPRPINKANSASAATIRQAVPTPQELVAPPVNS